MGHSKALAQTIAAEPASTGTPRMPVPTIPAANTAEANDPAIGRGASAVCKEVSMVTPCTCSIAAVPIALMTNGPVPRQRPDHQQKARAPLVGPCLRAIA